MNYIKSLIISYETKGEIGSIQFCSSSEADYRQTMRMFPLTREPSHHMQGIERATVYSQL